MHVRHLAAHVDRQVAIDTRLGEDGARLHAGRYQAVVDQAQFHDVVGLSRRFREVAAIHPEVRRDVARHVGVQLRGLGADRLLLVDHRRQRLVVYLDQFQSVVGGFTRLRDDRSDALSDESDAVDRQNGTKRYLRAGDDPVGPDPADLALDFLSPHDQPYAGRCPRGGEVDAHDLRVSMRRSQEGRVQRSGKPNVVDVSAFAGDELDVLAPPERLADIDVRLLCVSHRDRLKQNLVWTDSWSCRTGTCIRWMPSSPECATRACR